MRTVVVLLLAVLLPGCRTAKTQAEYPLRRAHGNWPNCTEDIEYGTLAPIAETKIQPAPRDSGEVVVELRDNDATPPLVPELHVSTRTTVDTVRVDYARPGIFPLGLRESGEYRVIVHSIGYQPTYATIVVRSGRRDTVVLPVEMMPVC